MIDFRTYLFYDETINVVRKI